MMFGLVCALLFLTDVAFGAVSFTTPANNDGTVTQDETDTTATIYTFVATSDGKQADGTTAATIASYVIDSQTPNNVFQIATSTSGAITLASGQRIDYETSQTYVVKVLATDNAGTQTSATGTVTISVNNLSDNPSYSITSTCAAVSADASSGTTIGTYTASDPDTPNTAPTYTYSGDDSGSAKFAYGSNGALTKSATAFNVATKSTYTLILTATDADNNAGSATVSVLVGGTCNSAAMHNGIIASLGTILLLIFSKLTF